MGDFALESLFKTVIEELARKFGGALPAYNALAKGKAGISYTTFTEELKPLLQSDSFDSEFKLYQMFDSDKDLVICQKEWEAAFKGCESLAKPLTERDSDLKKEQNQIKGTGDLIL